MSATFRIKSAFRLEARDSVVLRGEILSGSVAAGMTVALPALEVLVASVEYIESAGESDVGLLVDADASGRVLEAGRSAVNSQVTVG